jgi:hypothetical protein
MSTIEELLERKSSGSGLENREYGCMDVVLPTQHYPQRMLAQTSLTCGGYSAGIVHSRSNATEFVYLSSLIVA